MKYLFVGLICIACFPIIWKRLKLYKQKQDLLKACSKQGYTLMVLDETKLSMISYSLVFLAAFFLAFKNRENAQAVSLWSVVSLIALSELINAQLVRKSYYCDKFFIYYHRKFFYEDIKEMTLKTSLVLADAYVVRTTDQSYFNITKAFYEILEQGRHKCRDRKNDNSGLRNIL